MLDTALFMRKAMAFMDDDPLVLRCVTWLTPSLLRLEADCIVMLQQRDAFACCPSLAKIL